MNKKVILITGASSGFGKVAALKLLNNGYIVYGGARHTKKMKEIVDEGGHALHLDVTEDDSVKKVVKEVIEKEGRIDVLVNNAGYGTYGTVESIPMKEIKYQYEVNVFGVARMLKQVLPHMRKRKKGLIINVGSVASYFSALGFGWYASTKHALKAISDALRQEVKHIGIKVVLIEPGAVKTGFDTVAYDTLDKINHPDEYKPMMKKFKKAGVDLYKKCPGPKSTVYAIINAIESKNPKLEYRTTTDAKMMIWMEKHLPKKWVDSIILKMMKT